MVAVMPVPSRDQQLPWSVIYYQAAGGTTPALEFLTSCPGKIDAEFAAVLDAVAAAPPPPVLRRRQMGGDAREHGRLA